MAQTTIKMKTAKAVGEEFSFVVDSGLVCYVDWGDGNTVSQASTYDPIVGTVAGTTITLTISGITYFDCSGQQINQLTFVAANNLETLIMSNNKMLSCNLSSLTNLKTLWADNNILTSLDLKNLTKLESLIASSNYMSSLVTPSSGLANLTDCWVDGNRFSTLNLTGSSKIQTLNIEKNQLKSLTLSTLSAKAIAVFMDGNSLDYTSFWTKANVQKWYGISQSFKMPKSTYQINKEFTIDRDIYSVNQDKVELAPSSYTFTWYPLNNDGERGTKLVKGTEGSTTADYTTPSFSSEKHLFTFKKPFDNIILEIKNNKYLNFTMVSNPISIEDPTGICDAIKTGKLRWTTSAGAITLEADEPTEVTIYDASGVLRWKGEIYNATRIQLGKGVFIVNNKKISL